MAHIEWSGQRFGKLVAVEMAEYRRNGGSLWRFRCDCGSETIAMISNAKRGYTRSCGCTKFVAGGMSHTRTYKAWQNMVRRCTTPVNKNYKYYGAIGVRVCDRWMDFKNFLADMGEIPPNLTLDRINTYGNYEPGNCRWATHTEQAKNRRFKGRTYSHQGQVHTLPEWSRLVGISNGTLYSRIKRGVPVDIALQSPTQPGKRMRRIA